MGTAFGIGLRARSFPLVEQWHGREAELSAQLHKLAPAFRSGFPKGDPAYTPLMFGEGAGSVNCQQPAAAIIQQIVRDADSRLSPM
jgi:nitronate monooxygenase